MKKNYIIRLLYTIIISIVICTVISTVFFETVLTLGLMLKSLGLGAAIWLASEIAFDVILKKWPHQILPNYIALFIIIAIGTAAGTWLMGVKSISIILLICLCAEICGFFITIIYRQAYKKRLNVHLEKFKSVK